MENGCERAAAEIDTTLRASSGNNAQYASTVMPPSDGPTTAASFLIAERGDDFVSRARDVFDREHRETSADRACRSQD